MALIKKTIKGLDEELYREAKAQAAREGKNIGQWMNKAMAAKLKKGAKK